MPMNADNLSPYLHAPLQEGATLKMSVNEIELAILAQMVVRATKLAALRGFQVEGMELSMDLAALHSNGTPLDFHAWHLSDDLTFYNEICQLVLNMNRHTGKINGEWKPKFAKKTH